MTNANKEWTSIQINKYFILLFNPDNFDISNKSTCNNSKGLSFGETTGKNLFNGLHIYIVDIHFAFQSIFHCQQRNIIAVAF